MVKAVWGLGWKGGKKSKAGLVTLLVSGVAISSQGASLWQCSIYKTLGEIITPFAVFDVDGDRFKDVIFGNTRCIF